MTLFPPTTYVRPTSLLRLGLCLFLVQFTLRPLNQAHPPPITPPDDLLATVGTSPTINSPPQSLPWTNRLLFTRHSEALRTSSPPCPLRRCTLFVVPPWFSVLLLFPPTLLRNKTPPYLSPPPKLFFPMQIFPLFLPPPLDKGGSGPLPPFFPSLIFHCAYWLHAQLTPPILIFPLFSGQYPSLSKVSTEISPHFVREKLLPIFFQSRPPKPRF